MPNNHIKSGRKKRRSFIATLFAAGFWLSAFIGNASLFVRIDCPLSMGKLTFGNLAQMSLVGRNRTTRKQKFARCEWLLSI
jgi:hypothetical protein